MVNSAATPVTKTLIYCRPAKFCGKYRQMVNTAKQRRSLPMTISMTGFAAARGQGAGHSWAWDIRAVNGKGLDLRLRVPDWIDGLELALRGELSRALQRGNVSLSLKVARDGLADGAEGMRVNTPALASVLAALHSVITGQLDRIATLAADAATEAQARRDAAATTLRDALTRVLANAEGVDETRLAQELALIAVKNDVTEELDRLSAHVDAARLLLAESAPVGRKFDFLMQEFMREANTLCSKSQALALTRIGLDLKTVIDQMREQVQNVE